MKNWKYCAFVYCVFNFQYIDTHMYPHTHAHTHILSRVWVTACVRVRSQRWSYLIALNYACFKMCSWGEPAGIPAGQDVQNSPAFIKKIWDCTECRRPRTESPQVSCWIDPSPARSGAVSEPLSPGALFWIGLRSLDAQILKATLTDL